MMRRGPLADFPLADLLRTAAAEGLSGSIALEESTIEGTVYLVNGFICDAQVKGMVSEAALHGAEPTRDQVSDHIVATLAVLTQVSVGWFRHEPFGAAHLETRLRFPTEEMLQAAEAQRANASGLDGWEQHPLVLQEPDGTRSALPMDAWRVIVAMAMPANAIQVMQQLGWPPQRLAAALNAMEAADLISHGRSAVVETLIPEPRPAVRRVQASSAGSAESERRRAFFAR